MGPGAIPALMRRASGRTLGRAAARARWRTRSAVIDAAIVAASLCAFFPPAMAQIMTADHHLRAQPENLSWGWIPTDKPPVLNIQSGDTVRIDTISHHGSTQDEDPVVFLGGFGVQPEEILQDVRDFWASKPGRPREGRTGAHVLTGPIAIMGAEPGDMLEIQILEVSSRVPYGFNSAGARSGALGDSYPGWRAGDPGADISGTSRTIVRTAISDGREFALIRDGVHVPLAPFMGIMAIAPQAPTVGQPGVTVAGVQSSRPPGVYGGNLDIKLLTAGAT
ncbi:MAG: acetamidase/formamidase family protein, partial [Gammaproteobacteria bacterium]|nr:acetamidase/formamidase family protein [Gammaproteobacteria bacterium]